MGETKKEKFKRIAEKRTNRVIDTMQLIGNLANTSSYEYSQKDVDKMFKAIEASVADAKRAYSRQGNSKSSQFTFDN